MKLRIAFRIAFLGVALLLVSQAHAQRREHERERFNTPHWVFDDRFHHNHYYPAPGYSIAALPPGNLAVSFASRRFWFQSGVWFERVGPNYVVVRPPPGILVPVLPPTSTTVWVAGIPYYYANDVYYAAAPGGYVVTNPPMAAEAGPSPGAPPGPQASAPQPPQGPQASNWYYCESAKAYYPYVVQCKEGWKQVPASPPR
jgi:uncharacterized protein DUF6515